MATRQSSIVTPAVITLGRLAFEKGDHAATALLSQPKRLAVLLYLLLSPRGGSVSRERVIAVFWPESDSSQARNALRQTLSHIRSCLGRDTVESVGAHGISIAPRLTCDAVQFEMLLDANRREDALRLYGGELLPGFHIGKAPEFADWLDSRRRYLAQRAAKAAWDLSAECEAAGDISDAAFWGKRALALSPFSESEVQRLLRLLDRIGDYSGALRAYHGLKRTLFVEFGVSPSAETARLATAIRERYDAEAKATPIGSRRSSIDRRVGERRRTQVKWDREERRRLPDRRSADRRSGHDRRAL